MQTYRIIADDGREATLSVIPNSSFPYQKIAKLTAINKIRRYKVEKINGD